MVVDGETSKKQSDANLPSLPEPLVFFIDCSLGRNVVSGKLRDAGEQVRVHDDHFPQGTKDEVWLTEVGNQGWVVFTKDTRIRYHKIETEALRRANVRAFVLSSKGDLSGQEMAGIFLKALPSIKAHCRKTSPPFIALVYKAGTVALIKQWP
jgi:hypothetical protein